MRFGVISVAMFATCDSGAEPGRAVVPWFEIRALASPSLLSACGPERQSLENTDICEDTVAIPC